MRKKVDRFFLAIPVAGSIITLQDFKEQYGSKSQFNATFGAGLKLWLTDFLGIRLQGSMMMPMVLNGVGLGCVIGSEDPAAVPTFIPGSPPSRENSPGVSL